MIDYAKKEDLKELYAIWKQVFAFDDGGYTDYLFKHDFKAEETLCIRNETEIMAIASFKHHAYMLHNRLIQGSMIYGVATLENYRHQGHMKKLMSLMHQVLGHRSLVTFIQAYTPALYEPFGFEVLYYRQKYELTSEQVQNVPTSGCTKDFTSLELVKMYGRFASRFTGYMVRDEVYYDNYIEEVKAQNGYIVAVKDAKGNLKGYATMYDRKTTVEIEEIVYFDISTLLKLVSLALRLKGKVTLHTTSSEHLSKIFKDVKCIPYAYTMAKINNYTLFNRLYECEVKTTKEAFDLSKKPLFMIESR